MEVAINRIIFEKPKSNQNAFIDGKDPAFEEACEGYGTTPADFMFVGISAGRLGALKTRMPFTKSASGRIMQRCLGRLGLSLDGEFCTNPRLANCYITNLVKGCCLTPNGMNRLPKLEEISYWLPKLNEEINKVKPKIVIALGSIVFSTLKECYRIEQLRFLHHPRWYQAHGALALSSPAFEMMLNEYSSALDLRIRKQ